MNVADIRTRIQAKVGDTSGTEVTNAQILAWINDGMTELARRTNQPQGSATTATIAGTGTYSLTAFAADILRLRSVQLDGSVLQAISMEEADTYLSDRDRGSAAGGTPSMYWVWADQINLWPKPTAAGVLKLFYVKRPAAVTGDADVPGIPVHMHTDLVAYVYAQVLDSLGQGERADRHSDRWQGRAMETAADADWPQRNTYPHITVSLDDAGWL